MKDIFWQVDPILGSTYSAYRYKKYTNQLPLVPPEPDYTLLTQHLLSHLHGSTMTICALEEYILAETSFRRTGYKEQVLRNLELTYRISVTSHNPARKPGEYTEDDLIHFV